MWPTHRLGPWLRGAQAGRGGIVIPGSRHCASLRLEPEQASLVFGDLEVPLPWSGYGRSDPSSPGSSWAFGPLDASRGGHPIGIALVATGPLREAVEPIAAMTRRKLLPATAVTGRPRDIALWWAQVGTPTTSGDLWLALVLCQLLVDRPDARARLADADRVDRLLHDLAHHRHDVRQNPVAGFLRTTLEIHVAMHLLGYEYRLGGRPVPGDPIRTTDEIVADVLRKLRANPYVQDLHIEESQVRRIVEHDYVDVEPWPFAALTVEDHVSTPRRGASELRPNVPLRGDRPLYPVVELGEVVGPTRRVSGGRTDRG